MRRVVSAGKLPRTLSALHYAHMRRKCNFGEGSLLPMGGVAESPSRTVGERMAPWSASAASDIVAPLGWPAPVPTRRAITATPSCVMPD